ncbi:hypothetical protein NPA31_000945 [Aurantimonas sp. MSK8Z-1]|nr:hypothetical protein [Aurantimonas sp. MSK8Z-1]MCQ8780743.1 hypothetical protein [Aurantimonas sp. CSK15Z-1]MCW4113526.1 hypothetical protein [Aurantimonas sp. MSK8Z-1]
MSRVARMTAFLAVAAALAGCNSTASGPALEEAAQPVAQKQEGRIPDYCPRISLREGTAILRKKVGEDIDYIASIGDTSRSCRLIDGQLHISVGVAGRLTAGAAAKARTEPLPVRVAVVRGTDVLYSKLGTVGVPVKGGGGADSFTYVDDAIVIPEPPEKNIIIYAGFDEGAPAKK